MAQKVWASTLGMNGEVLSKEIEATKKQPNDLKEGRKCNMRELKKRKGKKETNNKLGDININISILKLNVNGLKNTS